MDQTSRLHLVGRLSYYIGWVTLLCGALMHLHIATKLFLAISLSKRNLFEVSVACFVICLASEVRALSSAEKALPAVVKSQAAA